MIIKGFVAVNEKVMAENEGHRTYAAREASSTFAITESGAWNRMLQPHQREARERSTYIQRWFDLGYRVKSAKIRIDDVKETI